MKIRLSSQYDFRIVDVVAKVETTFKSTYYLIRKDAVPEVDGWASPGPFRGGKILYLSEDYNPEGLEHRKKFYYWVSTLDCHEEVPTTNHQARNLLQQEESE